MFSNDEVADYYDTTQNHYEKWWRLKNNLALHYGLWLKDTKTFKQALENTNRVLLEHACITNTDQVLDAGCGVGGSVFYIHQQTGARVTGISLSKKQLSFAKRHLVSDKLETRIDFQWMDFCNTTFDDASFEVIWACESVGHANDKAAFVKECRRLLKPGGKLVMIDFWLTKEDQHDKKELMKKWGNTWGVSQFISSDMFKSYLAQENFHHIEVIDYTQNIHKSAERLYRAALFGAIPSIIYNWLHPSVTPFAKNHYKCGFYQYQALKALLWKYKMIVATR